MRLRTMRPILYFVVMLLISGCATAPTRPTELIPGNYSYLKEYMAWFVQKEMKKNNVTGISVALVDDQQVIWSEGFGFADKEAGIRAGGDTVYRVGSISKLFTTMAALQLSEQGKLDLDMPLSTYVPNFSIRSRFAGAKPISPRNIMTHHSGIPSDRHQGMWTKKPVPIADLPDLISDDYAAFPPDTIYSYSNLGMSLLGLAVQNVSGKEFTVQMREAILTPLEMKSSYFSAGIDAMRPATKAYQDGDEKQEPLLRDIPAGGLNASVHDMSRFIRMVLAGGTLDGQRIIREETLREMLRQQNSNVALDGNFPVGLGWMLGGLGSINIANAGTVAHHGGATLYHRAQLIVLPDVKLGVVVLSNSGSAGKIVNDIATEALKLAVEIKIGRKQPEASHIVTGDFLSGEELNAYSGRYTTIGGIATLAPRSGYLKSELAGNSFRLVPRQDKQLQLQYRLLGLIPIDLGDLARIGIKREIVAGHELLWATDGTYEMLIAKKVTPEPITPAWRGRLGRYRIANIGDDVTMVDNIEIREEDGLLLLDYRLVEFGGAKISNVLRPIDNSEAVLAGLWRGMGETVRVVLKDGVEQLIYSGYRLAKQGAE